MPCSSGACDYPDEAFYEAHKKYMDDLKNNDNDNDKDRDMPCRSDNDYFPSVDSYEDIKKKFRHDSDVADMLCCVLNHFNDSWNSIYYNQNLPEHEHLKKVCGWWKEHLERDLSRLKDTFTAELISHCKTIIDSDKFDKQEKELIKRCKVNAVIELKEKY